MNSRNGIHVTYYVPGTFSKHGGIIVVEKEKALFSGSLYSRDRRQRTNKKSMTIQQWKILKNIKQDNGVKSDPGEVALHGVVRISLWGHLGCLCEGLGPGGSVYEMQCKYVVRKEVLIYAEKSELNPKCCFVRGILSLSLWVMGIVLLVFQTKSRTALTTRCCAFLFSQFHSQWISDWNV